MSTWEALLLLGLAGAGGVLALAAVGALAAGMAMYVWTWASTGRRPSWRELL